MAVKLGFIGFGGPAAHIAMLRDEVVHRRRWLSEERFLDLLGVTNLIPGPNSTEMVMHVGHVRAGWRGLVLAGAGFILPAATIVLALAWMYERYGSTPAGEGLMYGIRPVILAIVAQALIGLTRTAVTTRLLAVVGVATFLLYLAGAHELLLLFGAGLVVTLARGAGGAGRSAAALVPAAGVPALAAVSPAPFGFGTLFLTFLKIGAVLYGSGYVLLAFLQRDFVDRLGWLTQEQLLEAVAVGQVTPGPVLTTATFIGYLLGGMPGAVLATIGIFLPSFLFVAAVGPFVGRLRNSPRFAALLDGVSVAAVALMAAVTLQLAGSAIVDPLTLLLALLAALLLVRYRPNSAWLVLGGGLLGIAVS